jgi:hypothetical protein
MLGASAIILLPSVVEMAALVSTGTRPPPTRFDTASEAIWLVALILIAGYLLEALSTPMYQVLEGYVLWPKWLHNWRRHHHIRQLGKLNRQHDCARIAASKARDSFDGCDRGQFVPKTLAVQPDPVDHRSVNATRLGNVMRVMESYGKNHFAAAAILTGLLENLTGFSDQKGVLTFTAIPIGQGSIGPLYFGTTAFHLGLGYIHILLGLAAIGLIPIFCYRMAIKSATMWAGVVRALVNLGRIQLANELNLTLPDTHEEERKMWQALCNFVGHREADKIQGWAEELDSFKQQKAEPLVSRESGPTAGPNTNRTS